jgi:starvation-inducible DNA-binding protein
MKKTTTICNIGIIEENRYFVSNQLNILLSDQYVLFTKLFKYHWNVYGQFFGPLHSLFENGYKLMYETLDQTAERIVQLGFFSFGTLSEFSKFSRLSEEPEIYPKAEIIIDILTKDFESVIMQIRSLIIQTEITYKDEATTNFLATLLERYEKYLWILRTHNG